MICIHIIISKLNEHTIAGTDMTKLVYPELVVRTFIVCVGNRLIVEVKESPATQPIL
jgi:hypothetical protein